MAAEKQGKKVFYVLHAEGDTGQQLQQIKKYLTRGYTIVIGEIGTITLREDARGIKEICFASSDFLKKMETPFWEKCGKEGFK